MGTGGGSDGYCVPLWGNDLFLINRSIPNPSWQTYKIKAIQQAICKENIIEKITCYSVSYMYHNENTCITMKIHVLIAIIKHQIYIWIMGKLTAFCFLWINLENPVLVHYSDVPVFVT